MGFASHGNVVGLYVDCMMYIICAGWYKMSHSLYSTLHAHQAQPNTNKDVSCAPLTRVEDDAQGTERETKLPAGQRVNRG